ncbi:MAG: NAD-binding protein [Deltaproteobacteria bacterium]|nr:NAD-binding protein [Deltaproteobacteria bacterium]
MSPFLKVLKALRDLTTVRFFQITAATVALIVLSAVGVHYFEHAHGDANIGSLWDGIWWAIVTMGTVGYGDKYPLSPGGRVVGMVLIFSGVGLMSLFTATIASVFVEKKIREGRGLETVNEKGHIIICGWNNNTEEVISGLTVYGSQKETPIVLINELSIDEIDSLKLKYSKYKLRFLRGNYVHEDVLLRANVAKASFALIMADTSGRHSQENTDERTTLAALAIKSLAPQIKMIAELFHGENKPHLRRANVDEIIVRGEHVGSLLASAVNSPGIPGVFSGMLSLGDANKLRRVEIPRVFVGKTFRELSVFYREKKHAILIGLLKEKKAVKLADLLSDNTSMIDNFIREKIQEAKKDFYYERDETKGIINPEDDYVITGDDFAVVISRGMP